ncbi:VOC family protein [Tritonibacter sp. AK171]|uniref:VOC family protein n=1 Tax=Tritonibacter sp. AK171 TaxID=3048493 RepID=UPI0024C3CAFF|nr:VOC family protein [Tritonibacter sp. AK171]
MLLLDHMTVIAPSLAEGCAHVEECLGLKVPFGTRHIYMGTHNHRLQLGRRVYLEIVARDPDGVPPPCARWFGLDDQDSVQADWDAGRRYRAMIETPAGICELT